MGEDSAYATTDHSRIVPAVCSSVGSVCAARGCRRRAAACRASSPAHASPAFVASSQSPRLASECSFGQTGLLITQSKWALFMHTSEHKHTIIAVFSHLLISVLLLFFLRFTITRVLSRVVTDINGGWNLPPCVSTPTSLIDLAFKVFTGTKNTSAIYDIYCLT